MSLQYFATVLTWSLWLKSSFLRLPDEQVNRDNLNSRPG